jgi:hypothetical protein
LGVDPPSPVRLDENKIETLRIWGEGLSADWREEVRAAGKAITLLVEEIERLNVDLWNARAHVPGSLPPEGEDLNTPLQRRLVPRWDS